MIKSIEMKVKKAQLGHYNPGLLEKQVEIRKIENPGGNREAKIQAR